MKKLIYVLATIIIVSFVATACLLKEDVKKNLEKETNQSEVSNDLNDKTEITDSLSAVNDKKSNDDNLKSETTTNKIDNTKENDNKTVSNSNSSGNNDSSKSNATENNTNNIEKNSTTVTEQNNSQHIEQKNEEVKTKICTPKKFDMSFVRADFNSMAKCTETGDKYKALGYGYFCDFYQDDCGDAYYMLTLYERNTGVEFDFHNIELPN